jgi:site-specific recombinase XerC
LKNFHLPLPEQTYDELRSEAERRRVPATSLARQALQEWLQASKRLATRQAIAVYASELAGSEADLDPHLEAATVKLLLRTESSVENFTLP